MSSYTLIRGGTLVGKTVEKKDILVRDDIIEKIGVDLPTNLKMSVIDGKDCAIFPGLIDCHVHCREPGLAHKATLASEMKAATYGGIATICDMPNTIPPTTTIQALSEKIERTKNIPHADIRFFFGITDTSHLEELRTLWTDRSYRNLKDRCCGAKVYFDHSTGNQGITAHLLPEVFRLCASEKIPLVGHCEDVEINKISSAKIRDTSAASHSLRRPASSEVAAIAHAITLQRETGASFHVAHLSTKEGLALVREAKAEGLPTTCEVAPHHLFLTVDDYAALGALVKMNPPLRTAEDQAALWQGVLDGMVDCIATDHAPHTLAEKQCADPLQAPSGVPGVATSLLLLLSVVAGYWPHPRSKPKQLPALTLSDIYRCCFERPNAIFHLQRDSIAVGKRGVLTIVRLDEELSIHAKDIPSTCGWTPFEGWNVQAKVCGMLHVPTPR